MVSTHYLKSTLVEIGTTVADVDITEVLYVAFRIVGSGPGGDQVAFRTVPNTVPPVGEIMFHKWWEILIGFDRNLYTPLFNTDVEEGAGTGKAIVEDDDNTAIGRFRITIVQLDGTLVVWTWAVSTTFVASYSGRVTNDENHQPIEVKFISRGLRTVA